MEPSCDMQKMAPVSPLFENQKLVTREELSDILQLSKSTVSKLMNEGLPYLKIGRSVRYQVDKVLAWLQRRSVA